MATLPDVTTTAITVAVSIASAYPLIRRQVSVAWRETAEGWKARAEELKQSVSDADSERMVLRERVAKLESRPDMTDVANVLRDHGNLLLAITTVLGKIQERMEAHEEAAARRQLEVAEALRATIRPGSNPPTGGKT